MFIGRQAEIAQLNALWKRVRSSGSGLMVAMRGRRQVGKSTLAEHFVAQADAPNLFFAAAQGAPPAREIETFAAALVTLPEAEGLSGAAFGHWEAALSALAAAIDEPTIVVLDELPYLLAGDPALEGVVQRVWDRRLSKRPVLLILIGSDLSVMELIAAHDRPLYGRTREMVVDPLTVAEQADLLGVAPVDAIDAYLLTGGLPRLAQEWAGHRSPLDFARSQLRDSTSPLVVVGERALSAEFPAALQARQVLEVIGAGETTFTAISARAGINEGSLSRTLSLLETKRVIAADRPLSATPSRLVSYRVADPYLRFWLRFIGPHRELLMRGRGDQLADIIKAAWSDYRGGAVEPLVRASLARLLPQERFGTAREVGRFWTRRGDVEVDLVLADRASAPAAISAVGSIKWRSRRAFDRHDLTALVRERAKVPGAEEASLIGVCPSGFSTADLDVSLTAEDLVSAWRHDPAK